MEDNEIKQFCEQLRKIFPPGMKYITDEEGHTKSYPWREHPKLIMHRFKLLKEQFDYDLDFDEVLEAAQQYVSSFGADTEGMRILKYFIIKKNQKTGEYSSDLLTAIAMLDDDEPVKRTNDWATDIV